MTVSQLLLTTSGLLASLLYDMLRVTQLVFRFSEEIVPHVAVDLVCLWEEVSFRILLGGYLELESFTF